MYEVWHFDVSEVAVMALMAKLIRAFTLDDPSNYEEYYKDTSWRTFRLDDSIWSESGLERPSLGYYREMQVCYEQLLKEVADSSLCDVSQLKEQFNKLHLKNCELERELAIAKGNNEVLHRQLESALKWQTVNGKKNEIYESNGIEPIKPQSVERESNSTKFKSKSGATKQENQMLASAYYENSWDLSDIAKELQISENSVKVYLSTMQKHYKVKYIKGYKYICFDSEYGEVQWNLALYDKLSMKYPTNESVS